MNFRTHTRTRTRIAASVLAAGLFGASLIDAPLALSQAPADDPALQQTVQDDEKIAPLGEKAVISAGHADLGPLYVDGEMTFMVRDDSQVPPVWRHLEDVVFEVSDEAKQTLPEGEDFDFTGAKAGDEVWVVPQNEVPGVPWLGWNTQSPKVVDTTDRGVSLEFGGHEGEGDFSLFLQSGGFSEPQQLWNSRLKGNQPMWVELNTHTHANWVFTKPGVHLVGARAVVKDKDGKEHVSEQVVRFAVGEGTDVQEAAAAEFAGPWRTAEGEGGSDAENSGDKGEQGDVDKQDGAISPVLWVLGGLAVAALVVGALSFVWLRRARAERDEAAASIGRDA
ncbi:choice-of-anchor M domain-containing protein [Corynebacterium sp. 20_84]